MRQFQVITILLITASMGFAQATSPATPSDDTQTSAPDATTPEVNQMPPNPGEAPATPSSPTGPITPGATFPNPVPNPAGATNATTGNQAGATNSTLQPTVSNSGASQTTYTTPSVGNNANPATSGNSVNLASATRNLVIGGSDSAWAITSNTLGVAEAARLARAARAGHKPRVFTNADLARLRGNAPVSVVGNTAAPVTNEQTMPASDVDEQVGPTTPVVPNQGVQQPATQNPPPGAPKSPFRAKPSPVQPR